MAWIEADVEFNADRIERPIVGIASKLLRHDSGVHCHEKGQLLFSEKGAMTIMLGDLLSVLPPQRLAWIPPHLPHRVQLTEVVNYRSIYVDHEAFPALPNTHLIWNVSPPVEGDFRGDRCIALGDRLDARPCKKLAFSVVG